jgi:hypothetical protein
VLRTVWRPRTLLALIFVIGYQLRQSDRRAKEAAASAAAASQAALSARELDAFFDDTMPMHNKAAAAAAAEVDMPQPPGLLARTGSWAPWRLAGAVAGLR